MQKWEYLDLPMVIQNEMIVSEKVSSYFQVGGLFLNAVGEDGWELVSVDNGIAYFKRPVDEKHIGDVHYWPAPDVRLKIESS